jgi:WD40 repeat protein
VSAVAVSADGQVVSGGDDGVLGLWDPRAPEHPGRELGRHDGPVRAVAVSADGQVVSGGDDGVLRLWDPRAPDDPGRELGHHDYWVGAVAITADGQLLVATGAAVTLFEVTANGS